MSFTSNFSVQNYGFDGTLFDLEITSEHIVISCSDCSTPQVTFLDKVNLEVIKKIEMPRL